MTSTSTLFLPVSADEPPLCWEAQYQGYLPPLRALQQPAAPVYGSSPSQRSPRPQPPPTSSRARHASYRPTPWSCRGYERLHEPNSWIVTRDEVLLLLPFSKLCRAASNTTNHIQPTTETRAAQDNLIATDRGRSAASRGSLRSLVSLSSSGRTSGTAVALGMETSME